MYYDIIPFPSEFRSWNELLRTVASDIDKAIEITEKYGWHLDFIKARSFEELNTLLRDAEGYIRYPNDNATALLLSEINNLLDIKIYN